MTYRIPTRPDFEFFRCAPDTGTIELPIYSPGLPATEQPTTWLPFLRPEVPDPAPLPPRRVRRAMRGVRWAAPAVAVALFVTLLALYAGAAPGAWLLELSTGGVR